MAHESYEEEQSCDNYEIREGQEKYVKILFREESYVIQGAVFEVYRVMGCGFLEAVYQECLAREFKRSQIPFEAQTELLLIYKGEPLVQTYRPDFVCYGQIIVEIKAVKEISDEHRAQVFT